MPENGALCEEGAIRYTGDLFDGSRAKYDLKYYVSIARELQQAGVNILAIKDMAGITMPSARGGRAGQGDQGRDRPAGALAHA
ncbi:hypothetical protein ACTMU2_24140 [Cupriavidus basilensis]